MAADEQQELCQNQLADVQEGETPPPTSTRCPNLNAEAIFAIAHGELCLNRTPSVATEPLDENLQDLPPAKSPDGPYQPKQPHRWRFDAADIYQISLAAQPWLAKPIQKAAPIQKAG